MIGEPTNFVHLTHIGSGEMADGMQPVRCTSLLWYSGTCECLCECDRMLLLWQGFYLWIFRYLWPLATHLIQQVLLEFLQKYIWHPLQNPLSFPFIFYSLIIGAPARCLKVNMACCHWFNCLWHGCGSFPGAVVKPFLADEHWILYCMWGQHVVFKCAIEKMLIRFILIF